MLFNKIENQIRRSPLTTLTGVAVTIANPSLLKNPYNIALLALLSAIESTDKTQKRTKNEDKHEHEEIFL